MKWTKLLIVSDSHGEFANLRGAVMKESPFDILVHCGDVGGNLVKILEAESSFAIKAVKGNTDNFTHFPPMKNLK